MVVVHCWTRQTYVYRTMGKASLNYFDALFRRAVCVSVHWEQCIQWAFSPDLKPARQLSTCNQWAGIPYCRHFKITVEWPPARRWIRFLAQQVKSGFSMLGLSWFPKCIICQCRATVVRVWAGLLNIQNLLYSRISKKEIFLLEWILSLVNEFSCFAPALHNIITSKMDHLSRAAIH